MSAIKKSQVDFAAVPARLPDECPLCGSAVVSANLPYEYDDAGTIYRHKGTVPGFRCLACGNEFVSDAVGWMLMAAVLERLPDASERKRTLARQVRALEESAGRSPSSLSTQVGA